MTNLGKGMLPPQALDLEKAVLGALLQEPMSFYRVGGLILAESFYLESHQIIFSAISEMHMLQRSVDMLTVPAFLRTKGKLEAVGGNYAVLELTHNVRDSANITDHAKIIQQQYLKREFIRVCSEGLTMAYKDSTDVFEMYDLISAELFKKVSLNMAKQAEKFGDIFVQRVKEYAIPALDGMTGVGTGFLSLDQYTHGWQSSDLIIVAGRPGMGKTAFVLNLARHAAIKHETPVAIFSLEMGKEQLVDRMIAAETSIKYETIRTKQLADYEWSRMHNATALINSNIYIDDSSATPIQTLRSKATRLKHKHDIGLIIVDYLQLMKGDKETKGNREQEISSISQGLKSLAKDLNIPIICLSQLSRAVESRPGIGGKRPQLSDLRESGSIEQDADQVIFLYRPEYYGITENEEGMSTAGVCEVFWAKNRHGYLDSIDMGFNGAYMRFAELHNQPDPVFVQGSLPLADPDKTEQTYILKPSRSFDIDKEDAPF